MGDKHSPETYQLIESPSVEPTGIASDQLTLHDAAKRNTCISATSVRLADSTQKLEMYPREALDSTTVHAYSILVS